MESRIATGAPWAWALALALAAPACTIDVNTRDNDDDDDDDDSWTGSDDDAADDDGADDDAADDDAADDDAADDDASGDDDTFSDDDTFGDDDTVFRLLQQGTATFNPPSTWQNWAGTEYYTEAIGDYYTCYKEYDTTGVREDDCSQCDFSFDVRYDLVLDDSDPSLCLEIYDPGDGALLGMGFQYYYYYRGYGDIGLMYYDGGYGWYFWGIGIHNETQLDYYYYYYYIY